VPRGGRRGLRVWPQGLPAGLGAVPRRNRCQDVVQLHLGHSGGHPAGHQVLADDPDPAYLHNGPRHCPARRIGTNPYHRGRNRHRGHRGPVHFPGWALRVHLVGYRLDRRPGHAPGAGSVCRLAAKRAGGTRAAAGSACLSSARRRRRRVRPAPGRREPGRPMLGRPVESRGQLAHSREQPAWGRGRRAESRGRLSWGRERRARARGWVLLLGRFWPDRLGHSWCGREPVRSGPLPLLLKILAQPGRGPLVRRRLGRVLSGSVPRGSVPRGLVPRGRERSGRVRSGWRPFDRRPLDRRLHDWGLHDWGLHDWGRPESGPVRLCRTGLCLRGRARSWPVGPGKRAGRPRDEMSMVPRGRKELRGQMGRPPVPLWQPAWSNERRCWSRAP
jgi:hypothetical protein